MNKEDEWAEGDYLDWLDYIDEELAADPAYPSYPTQGVPNIGPASTTSKSQKLPKAKKKGSYSLPWDWDKDSEEKEAKKQKRMEERVQEAKRIKWKVIDRDYEYEVIVGGKKLGNVIKANGKWIVKPGFKWNEDSYRHRDLAKSSYGDFRESGHALVDLWCLS